MFSRLASVRQNWLQVSLAICIAAGIAFLTREFGAPAGIAIWALATTFACVGLVLRISTPVRFSRRLRLDNPSQKTLRLLSQSGLVKLRTNALFIATLILLAAGFGATSFPGRLIAVPLLAAMISVAILAVAGQFFRDSGSAAALNAVVPDSLLLARISGKTAATKFAAGWTVSGRISGLRSAALLSHPPIAAAEAVLRAQYAPNSVRLAPDQIGKSFVDDLRLRLAGWRWVSAVAATASVLALILVLTIPDGALSARFNGSQLPQRSETPEEQTDPPPSDPESEPEPEPESAPDDGSGGGGGTGEDEGEAEGQQGGGSENPGDSGGADDPGQGDGGAGAGAESPGEGEEPAADSEPDTDGQGQSGSAGDDRSGADATDSGSGPQHSDAKREDGPSDSPRDANSDEAQDVEGAGAGQGESDGSDPDQAQPDDTGGNDGSDPGAPDQAGPDQQAGAQAGAVPGGSEPGDAETAGAAPGESGDGDLKTGAANGGQPQPGEADSGGADTVPSDVEAGEVAADPDQAGLAEDISIAPDGPDAPVEAAEIQTGAVDVGASNDPPLDSAAVTAGATSADPDSDRAPEHAAGRAAQLFAEPGAQPEAVVLSLPSREDEPLPDLPATMQPRQVLPAWIQELVR